MKITIDTSQDSKEEIKKIINLLNHLIQEQTSVNQPVNQNFDSSPEQPGLMNLFNTEKPLKEVVDEDEKKETVEESPKDENSDSGIKIIEY